jgi:hypothetical protein
MSVTLDYTSAPFVRCGNKLKLCSNGGDTGSKKCKRGYGEAYGRGLAKSVFGGKMASVAVKMFSHLIWFVNKFKNFVLSM